MAYPADILSYTSVAGTTLVADADHANMHNQVGSAVVAIETVVGTTLGTNLMKNFAAGDFPAKTKNETFGTSTWIGGTIGTALIGTSTITGGTISSLFVNGTVGTSVVGTSTIQGGTAKAVDMRGFYSTPVSTTLVVANPGTLDLSLSNEFRVTFGTANGTLAVINGVAGQKFLVSTKQDAVGTRLMTWFDTVSWSGGTPTLTVTANKKDTFGFLAITGTTFDGFTIGTNT